MITLILKALIFDKDFINFPDHLPLFFYFYFLVLSNVDKRFLYDVGVYDSDDDDDENVCSLLSLIT